MAQESGQSGHWLPALRPESLPPSPIIDPTASTGQKTHEHDIGDLDDTQSTHQTSKSDVSQSIPLYATTPGPEISTSAGLGGPVRSVDVPGAKAGLASHSAWPADEISSDEDDERLDPAWGLRTLAPPFLSDATRTTSFPDFTSPNHNHESERPYPIPFSQEEESVQRLRQESYHRESFGEDADQPVSATDHTWMDEAEEPMLDYTVTQASEQDREAHAFGETPDERFEAGVPLMQTETEHDFGLPAPIHSQSRDPFDDAGEEDDEVAFFSKMENNTKPPRRDERPLAGRKSTMDIMSAVDPFPDLDEDSPEANFFAQQAGEDTANQQDESTDDPLEAFDQVNPETANDEAMWQAALGDDDFLMEDSDELLPDSDSETADPVQALINNSKMTHHRDSVDSDIPNPKFNPGVAQSRPAYIPHQPSTSDLPHPTHSNLGLSRQALAPMNSFQTHLQSQQPLSPISPSSFADQSKGGYVSPYDMPLELSKQKKRTQVAQSGSMPAVPPPPRSSSYSVKHGSSASMPQTSNVPAPAPVPTRSTPIISQPPPDMRARSTSLQKQAEAKTKSETPAFFEELPIVTKARPASGRYAAQQNMATPPPQSIFQPPVPIVPLEPTRVPSPVRSSDSYSHYQLQPPEKIDPYANIATAVPSVPVPTATAARYSPAPAATSGAPRISPTPRYSPAPPPQTTSIPPTNRYATQSVPPSNSVVPVTTTPPTATPISAVPITPPVTTSTAPPSNRYAAPQPPPFNAQSFLPRTSSPLAQHRRSVDEQSSLSRTVSNPVKGPLSTPNLGRYETYHGAQPVKPAPVDTTTAPPRRPQSQSPGKQGIRGPNAFTPLDPTARPATMNGRASPPRHVPQPSIPAIGRQHMQRAPTQELDFIPPTGDASFDPLERWKGAPVFRFGFGGTTISTFPKHVPRYAAGAARPLIKSTAGEVVIKNAKESVTLPEMVSSFPGPLRNKSKKKDLITWLGSQIVRLEAEAAPATIVHGLADSHKRHEERILLWKIVRALVEHDGVLDSIEGIKSINTILFPDLYVLDEASATQYRGETLDGIYRPSGTRIRADSIEAIAMETLRKQLLKGKRTEAVWQAVDNRLWSHALLIASTLDRSTWTQVVSEFVKREVKTAGENTESLSALYEIFGGNLEACIDQLVPPSARAGMQMVSTVQSGGPTKNALDGLNKWKETLSLVLNNRSTGDYQALAYLGKLLCEFGRVEAGHICYLFSRSPAQPPLFGGIDDAQANIVLLGADEKADPLKYGNNIESITLTEVYEFATLVLASGSATQFMPHLSAYKLERARILAESGLKIEAQAYCEAIGSTLKANTKVSPYYHPVLLGELDELSNRLRQAPVQSSSWIAKPSLEKVSGSVWNKFSTFVTGEDSDTESRGSAKAASEAGPFARVSGTPSVSRSGSQVDLASYPMAAPAIPHTAAASRYAPGGGQSARSSSELHRTQLSQTSLSPPSTSYGGYQPSPYEPNLNTQYSEVAQSTGLNLAYDNSPPVQQMTSPTRQVFAGNEWQASPPSTAGRRQASLGRRNTPSPGPGPKPSYIPQQTPESYPAPAASDLYRGLQSTSAYMPQAVINYSNAQPVAEGYTPQPAMNSYGSQSIHDSQTVQSMPQTDPQSVQPQFGGYLPPTPEMPGYRPTDVVEPQESSYEPQPYGYEPPTDTGYQPYEPEVDSESDNSNKKNKSKKKSFMDDDDDDFPSVSKRATTQTAKVANAGGDDAARKKANDEAADAAFRAAADADAAQSKQKADGRKSGSWMSGWFGGSKKPDDLSGSKGAAPTVYKAKLGEDKMSLYYDKDLKKWVNPNDPDSGKPKTATPPPPPRMGGTPLPASVGGPPPAGPPRAATGPPMGPPSIGVSSGPPSRVGTPASGIGATLPPSVAAGLNQDYSRPSTAGGSTPPPGAGSLAPPMAAGNRPASIASNASSIDDLIGPAQGRKSVRGPKKGAKGGRYVDVMAK